MLPAQHLGQRASSPGFRRRNRFLRPSASSHRTATRPSRNANEGPFHAPLPTPIRPVRPVRPTPHQLAGPRRRANNAARRPRRPQHRPRQHGRPHRRCRRGRERSEDGLRRRGQRRPVEDHGQRRELGVSVRRTNHPLPRRRRRGAVGPAGRLGRLRRGQPAQQRVMGRRRLQVRRRRQDVDEHGPQKDAPHRPCRRAPAESGDRLRRRSRTRVGSEQGARPVQD